MQKFLWKIGGEAGFGIMTVGQTFAKIASRSGYKVYDYNEYPSLIRGGHNTYEVAFSEEEIYSSKLDIDLLVCLNQETFDTHKHRLTKESIVVYDPEDFKPEGEFVPIEVPFRKFVRDDKVEYIMANTIALGISLALLSAEVKFLHDIIEKQFARKGEQVVAFNNKFADLGYNHIKEHYAEMIKPYMVNKPKVENLVLSGNDAFSLGAVIADCRLHSQYPMTPTSQVLAILAGWQEQTGMVVRHAEDEIAVINTALGGAFMGVRSAVATSGGGFALMVETLSFAGVAEIPVVVFLGMRPGPATGMPTWTEQGDLLFAAHAGHGEFPKIILAPGDTQEMLELTLKGFELSDKYQTPVIVLADKLLCESHYSMSRNWLNDLMKNHKINRGKIIDKTAENKYLRYKLERDGISPMLIPGQEGQYYQANSYSHTEDSHTTEHSKERKDQVDKLNRKWQTYLETDYQGPNTFGKPERAKVVFVSWGANKGPILDAQKMLGEKGLETAFIYFTHVYPMKELPALEPSKKYILVENNSHAQFGQLLRQQTGLNIEDKILKYDGRPFYPEEIVEQVTKLT